MFSNCKCLKEQIFKFSKHAHIIVHRNSDYAVSLSVFLPSGFVVPTPTAIKFSYNTCTWVGVIQFVAAKQTFCCINISQCK